MAPKKQATVVEEKVDPRIANAAKYQRDEYGLLNNVDYIFQEDGSVDWRAMVSDKFLYPNREWFESKSKEVPTSIEGLKDYQLLIKLGGIREIAKIRGFNEVRFKVNKSEEDQCCVTCSMVFDPNYENPNGVYYEEVANATIDNTSGFTRKFLESIAANRAFIRCVRGFLNINIVGADEVDGSEKGEKEESGETKSKGLSSKSFTPNGTLEKWANSNGYEDYVSFKAVLKKLWEDDVYRNEDVKDWKDFSDIPAKEARIILGVLTEKV